jgi:uncharacterized membrane protein YhaH (DUF805 family)
MTFRIIFEGKTMPGVDQQTATRNAVEQLKMTAAQAQILFGGKTIIFKRGVAKDKVIPYVERLTKAGLRVRIEAEVESTEPTVTTVAPGPIGNADATPAPLAVRRPRRGEEIECPRCHEKQPRLNLCRSCGLDIPRYLEKQKAEEAKLRAEQAAIVRATIKAANRARMMAETAHDNNRAAFFGFSLDDRFSRREYVLVSWAPIAAFVLLWALALNIPRIGMLCVTFMTMLFPFAVYWFARACAMRCHDLGRSGWMAWLMLLPGINVAFLLYLLFASGTRTPNRYGAAPYPPRWGASIACFLALFLIMTVASYGIERQIAKKRNLRKDNAIPTSLIKQPRTDTQEPERNTVRTFNTST